MRDLVYLCRGRGPLLQVDVSHRAFNWRKSALQGRIR